MNPSARRQRLFELLGDGIAILPAAKETTRNSDTEYEFRQDSDFYYLTGFEEPGAIAVFNPSESAERYVLFVRPRDKEQETWVGRRAGVEGAVEQFGADMAYPLSEFEERLRGYLIGRPMLYCRTDTAERILGPLGAARTFHLKDGRPVPVGIGELASLLAEMRLRKDSTEIDLLRRAAAITGAGHLEAMKFAKPGVGEDRVQAVMEYVFRAGGSSRNAYPSIVASGPNACILHYVENDRQMQDGDLLLIDAAAEYGYMGADVTRTFPVNGKFTAPQAAVYEVVLAAQRAAFDEVLVGATYERMHLAARKVITEGLVELGLLPKGTDQSIAMHHYREFFMHGTGHWLGMDVHDVGAYKNAAGSRVLESGMVFTVEPGIYIDPEREVGKFALLEYDLDDWMERRYRLGTEAARKVEAEERDEAGYVEHAIPTEFRGIGVRIEDDLLVTSDGYEILTADVPTALGDVEEVCSLQSALG
ncbi:MAG: M24 family metallopeptidase [Gammaproteobacteria bacterium]|nr:M24 family metallopeptidase [Gammaproteobacteria bacterium]